MDTGVTPSPRKARKTVRSGGNVTAIAPNINQSVSNAISSSISNPVRNNARKSTGTRNIVSNSDQINQTIAGRTRRSRRISQDTTLPISQPSCSRDDDSSDSDTQRPRTRNSVTNSQNSTVPFSQPGCSRDPDSSDSDITLPRTRISTRNSLNSTVPLSQPSSSRDPDSLDCDTSPAPTQKILRRNAPLSATNTSKQVRAVQFSSSEPSTSEESDVEEMLRKKAEKKTKAKALPQKTVNPTNMPEKSLINPNNLVSQCVFYILSANRSKKAIKKRDIIQHVFEGRNTQMFPETIKRAALMLQKTFGFELMELKNSKNEYLLVNKLCHQYGVQAFAEYSHNDRQKQGFIFYILTLIFMNENSIMEDQLWKALDPLGVEIKSRKPHPVFGDVQKFVTTTLVKQMYLERRQLSKDPPQYELTWGERAHKEVMKEDLLEFVCKIMPDTTPEEWILQYKDAKGRSPDGDTEME